MKKLLLSVIMLALVAISGQGQTNNYTIHGNFSEIAEAVSKQGFRFDSVTVVDPATNEVIARQTISNGEFSISGIVEKPFYAQFNLWLSSEVNGERKSKKTRMLMVIEPGDIVFDGNNKIPVIRGTPLNDLLTEVISKREMPDFTMTVKELVILHKDDASSIPLLLLLDNYMEDPKTLLELISQFSEDIQHHPNVMKVKEKAEAILTRWGIGDMFKDFTVEYNGKQQHLSDYVGNGQYVLVDFWASWCGPCRKEIPNLIAAYNKYKEKGLQVIGVAVSDEPANTEAAIKEMNIPYPQIINAQDIASKIYGIDAIPHIILFAPDGTILARELRGEDIDKKLAEIFVEQR